MELKFQLLSALQMRQIQIQELLESGILTRYQLTELRTLGLMQLALQVLIHVCIFMKDLVAHLHV
jgi:hypothetical protein